MAVTLITGTSSGIGMATALHFASRGHQVYASMRNPEHARNLREAAAATKLSLEIIQLDVNDEASVQRAVRDIRVREKHIDVLVNNAGIAPMGSIELTSEATAKAVFETNFFGPLRTIRAVLPSMRERRSGTIVNVTSVVGRVAPAGGGVYPASKFALEAASEGLAQEVYSFGIRVAIVEPSFTVTPILEKTIDSLPLDPGSPYADTERRVKLMFDQARSTGGDPRAVAETIEHAVTTTEPKLRYIIGADAQAFVTARSRTTDEHWIAMGRHMTDEEYFAEFGALFATTAQA
jgi:NAD(P)-dependent dehydrogenase (short-subunit alcohol dehydrogenase family)